MNTVRKIAVSLLLTLPLLATTAQAQAPQSQQRPQLVTNADGTVTFTPAGGAPVTLSAALMDQITVAMAAGSESAVAEAIADVISNNEAVFTADPGLLAGLASIGATLNPALGDAVARGALTGASEIDVLGSNPSLGNQILAGVSSSGGTVSQSTRSLVQTLIAANETNNADTTGDDDNNTDDDDDAENPATTSPTS